MTRASVYVRFQRIFNVPSFPLTVQRRELCAAQLWHRTYTSTATTQGQSVQEENSLPRYERKHYYPLKIGQRLKDRYRVIAKLGYGGYSTVWLARDERSCYVKSMLSIVTNLAIDHKSMPVSRCASTTKRRTLP